MWLQQAIDNFPQLQGQFRETAAPVMNLQQIIARQEAANPTDPATPPNDDVRCIPKVMQVIINMCYAVVYRNPYIHTPPTNPPIHFQNWMLFRNRIKGLKLGRINAYCGY